MCCLRSSKSKLSSEPDTRSCKQTNTSKKWDFTKRSCRIPFSLRRYSRIHFLVSRIELDFIIFFPFFLSLIISFLFLSFIIICFSVKFIVIMCKYCNWFFSQYEIRKQLFPSLQANDKHFNQELLVYIKRVLLLRFKNIKNNSTNLKIATTTSKGVQNPQ